jgi:hypothetical protein
MKDKYRRGKVKYWRWTAGRQGSGYKIFYMWNWLFDFLIIRYPTGSYIHWHNDPVPSPKKHHRINIVLWEAEEGGEFERIVAVDPMAWPDLKPTRRFIKTKQRFVHFRPDIEDHMVHKITKGERWVLSLGWCTNGT